MKQFFIFLLACCFGCILGNVVCEVYDYFSKPQFEITDYKVTVTTKLPLTSDFTIDPVQMIAMDKEYVYNFADSIRKANKDTISVNIDLYECEVELSGEVDTLTKCTPVTVTNIFQVNKMNYKTMDFDADVFGFVHDTKGESYIVHQEHKHWGGDNNMIDTPLDVSLAQAFENLNKVNFKKPNSRFVTLRSMVGPYPANPQWIFGNDSRGVLYVDVCTGKVTDKHPAFNPEPYK